MARVNVEYIDPFEGEPYAQFTFTYRSRGEFYINTSHEVGLIIDFVQIRNAPRSGYSC